MGYISAHKQSGRITECCQSSIPTISFEAFSKILLGSVKSRDVEGLDGKRGGLAECRDTELFSGSGCQYLVRFTRGLQGGSIYMDRGQHLPRLAPGTTIRIVQ